MMDLADPPILQHYLLESPWPVAAALVIVAAAMMVVGLREKRKKLKAGALLTALAAGAVLAAATAISTNREQLLDHTADLLAMTDPVNPTGLQALFANDLVLVNTAGHVWLDRAEMLNRLNRLESETPIGSHKVTDIKAEARGDKGYVDVRLSTRPREGTPIGNLPVLSRWVLVWEQQSDGGWLLAEVRWVEFQLGAPDAAVLR